MSGRSRLVDQVWLSVERDHGVSPESRSIGMHGPTEVTCLHVLGIEGCVGTIYGLVVAIGNQTCGYTCLYGPYGPPILGPLGT